MDMRNRGMMAGIERVQKKKTRDPYAWEEKKGWQVAYRARGHGVFIRPSGMV